MKPLLLALALSVAQLVDVGTAEACNKGREVCSFTLFNNTSVELESFWASPARINSWENDILGDGTLKAGRDVSINMTDHRPDCIYDFRFKFVDNRVLERRAVNVCKLGRYTLNE